jgi:hypothetical protein
MRKNLKYLAILATGMLLISASMKEKKVKLFNGKDLNNWHKVVFEPVASLDEVFRVEDGIIKVSGKPNGYIVTSESYSNYRLHVEWRWAAEPSNSGVLLHVREHNPGEFPLCIEAQLMHQNAGDIVLIGMGAGISRGDSSYVIEPEERRYESIKKFEESSENTPGEWNVYEITCQDDNIELIVNGVVQNTASEASSSSGRIALQSEGSSIEFRNIYIVPLGD